MEKITLLVFIILISCSSLHEQQEQSFEGFTKKTAPTAGESKLLKVIQDLEINQARLLTQVEELERIQKSQQQYISLLEKALEESPKNSKKQEKIPVFTIIDNIKSERKIERKLKKTPSENDIRSKNYMDELKTAKELFVQKKHSQAFLAFSKLDRDFDLNISQGEPLFWLARCWYEMSEYKSANNYFKNFIERFPNSKHTPTARSYLVKSESLGNSELKNGQNER